MALGPGILQVRETSATTRAAGHARPGQPSPARFWLPSLCIAVVRVTPNVNLMLWHDVVPRVGCPEPLRTCRVLCIALLRALRSVNEAGTTKEKAKGKGWKMWLAAVASHALPRVAFQDLLHDAGTRH